MEKRRIESEIKYIVEQIVIKYKPLKIILFGSAVRDDVEEVNDLDLLVIKEDVPRYGLDRMRELDELIDRNVGSDMLVYRPDELDQRLKLGDPFITSIIEKGRVLYG